MPGLGGWDKILALSPFMRRIFIDEFIQQKQKEHEAMENARKKK